MAINIADNMGYNGKKPLDGRTEYATLAAMKAVADANINEGCLAYNKEDGKYYKFLSTNTVDETTGKWREFQTGGGGQTYNDFTGATASTAGAHGLVPAPSAGDEGKVLFGNGAWGALPSVDYSQQSVEANIYSTIEKVIGQWTDGKLLYAKTIDCGALPSSTVKTVPHNISNIDKVIFINGHSSNPQYKVFNPLPFAHTDGNYSIVTLAEDQNIKIKTNESWTDYTESFVTLYYTKTTDSPLPSDEKFAGTWYNGSVILKKTVDLGSDVEITPTGWYTSSISNSGISKITYAFSVSNTGTYTPLMCAVDNGDYIRFKACRGDGNTASARYITYHYTKSSS